MQNRDDYLKAIGIQQWQRREQASDLPAWHSQGDIDAAPFAFIFEPPSSVALDWAHPELQLLSKVIQAVGLSPEEAVLLWPLQTPAQEQAPKLPQSSCCVVFGNTLNTQVEHTKKIVTVPLAQLMQDTDAKRKLWQALKAAKHD